MYKRAAPLHKRYIRFGLGFASERGTLSVGNDSREEGGAVYRGTILNGEGFSKCVRMSVASYYLRPETAHVKGVR
jgi:hypothetical protein